MTEGDRTARGVAAAARAAPREQPATDAGGDGPRATPGEVGRATRRRAALAFAARLTLAVGVLAALLAQSDLGQVFQAIVRVSPAWLALALLTQLMGKVIWAMRWSATLGMFGVSVPLGRLVRALFVGQFFNNLLPSSVGGDFYRSYWILDDPRLYRQSLLLVFLERFLGLIALGFISFPALIVLVARTGTAWSPSLLMVLALLAGLCGSPIMLHPAVFGWVDRRLDAARVHALEDLRRKIRESVRLLHRAGWWTSRAFLLSFVVQLVGVGFYYFLGRGLDVPMAAWQYLVVVPLVAIATLVPVTLQGIGVREGALVALTAALHIGMTASQGLALGMLASAALVFVSLIGGGFYIAGTRQATRTG